MSSAEIDTYAAELSLILTEIGRSLAGLSDAQLAARPAASGNSPYTIANHVLEATRVYALGFGCRRPVSRDRQREFEAPATSLEEVGRRLRDLDDELGAALSELAQEALDERLTPARELWGTGSIREISRREALIESVRHAAVHLGELRLTRDLVTAGAR